jgi:hypothetical protein
MASREGAGARFRLRPSSGATAVRRVVVALGLSLGLVLVGRASAQTGAPGTPPNGAKHQEGALLALGRNYPNPFSPATRIPFTVGDAPACTNPGRRYQVSLRIYNLLAQLVAVPVMAEGGSVGATGASGEPNAGQPVQSLALPCGQYTAYWNGMDLGSTHEVASGLYLYRLEVNGKAVVRKMLIQR